MGFVTNILGGQVSKKAAKQSRIIEAVRAVNEKESQRVQQVRADVLTRKEKIKQVREGRIRRGSIVQRATNAGARLEGTSGVSGATSSVRSQTSENIGTLGAFQSFAQELSRLSQKDAALVEGLATIKRKAEKKIATLNMIGGIIDIAGADPGGFFSGGGLGFGSGLSSISGGVGGGGGGAAGGAASAAGQAAGSAATSAVASGAFTASAAAATGQVSGALILGGASDRRLKKDIKRIGRHSAGVPLYSWTYIWGVKAIGVMADELKTVIPEAVYDYAGFDFVDNDMIGGRA